MNASVLSFQRLCTFEPTVSKSSKATASRFSFVYVFSWYEKAKVFATEVHKFLVLRDSVWKEDCSFRCYDILG